MPRPMSTAMETWLSGTVLPVAVFLQAQFISGPLYLWTGYGNISWNGQTWTGIGTLLGMSQVSEGSTVEAKGISLSLSGFDANALSLVTGEFQLGLPVTLYLVGFNGGSIIANPLVAFAGRLDQPTIDIDGDKATISINCENRLLDMNVACDRRYTPDDQQRDWPGDLSMNFVPNIQEMSLNWGQAPTTQANI